MNFSSLSSHECPSGQVVPMGAIKPSQANATIGDRHKGARLNNKNKTTPGCGLSGIIWKGGGMVDAK